jgi:myo-inositol 2-dehydrogenase/D-chiro-inositol 1-dehydrogenase
MARFFIPDIVEVSAVGSNVFSDDIEELGDFDSVVVTLRGSGGELITITNSRHCAFGYDQRLEAFGSEGLLSASNVTPTNVKKYSRGGTEESSPYLPFFLERYVQAYSAELEAFAHSIRTGAPCSPSFEDGVAALVLANAAAESATKGKTVTIGKN